MKSGSRGNRDLSKLNVLDYPAEVPQ